MMYRQPRDANVQGCPSSRALCCLPVPVCIRSLRRKHAYLVQNLGASYVQIWKCVLNATLGIGRVSLFRIRK